MSLHNLGREYKIRPVDWDILNAVVMISPFFCVWGWTKYLKLPVRSDWRSRASAFGLSAPILSVAIWVMTLLLARITHLSTSAPLIRHFTAIGICIPALGLLVGLAGRPLLILAIVPSSAGAILFWYGTTLP
jgi:hypothetical protein